MSPGKLIRGCLNFALHPLHWEVVKAPKFQNARFRMADGLARAKSHNFEVATIIDVGASDGKWSRQAMQEFPAARALAFEPLAERESALKDMRAKNGNFDFVLAAAGDRIDSIRLKVADDLDGSSIDDTGTGTMRDVALTTIDHEVGQRSLRGPYLIKLDTHGFELPILAGAEQTLRQASLVVIEVYNFQITGECLRFHEMAAHMESLGFRCFDLVDPMLRVKDHAFWQMDMFFAPVSAPMFAYSQYR